MKICATVAEYNPLHLGHVKHLDYIKKVLGAENTVVIMSGNFTQRGEPAVLDKFTRAKHAVLAGADVVIELPTVFATANAELFAKGSVAIIDSLNAVDGLCFGTESGDKESFISLAKALNDESKEFKKALKDCLEDGVSLAKAKFLALKSLGKDYDENLIKTPNNILGLEYVKALLTAKNSIDFYPMLREGDHNDVTLKKGVTSATSIRNVIKAERFKKLKKNVPPFVYKDLCEYPYFFDKLSLAKIITASAEEMSEISDCTEGLENRIKALAKDSRSISELIEKASTKRYTETRIRRIITANLLGIKKTLIESTLKDGLYAKVLAVNSEKKELISFLSKSSSIPVLTRKSDCQKLNKQAQQCWETDCLTNDLYNLATNQKTNENQMLII